jgi:hypothetical protein
VSAPLRRSAPLRPCIKRTPRYTRGLIPADTARQRRDDHVAIRLGRLEDKRLVDSCMSSLCQNLSNSSCGDVVAEMLTSDNGLERSKLEKMIFDPPRAAVAPDESRIRQQAVVSHSSIPLHLTQRPPYKKSLRWGPIPPWRCVGRRVGKLYTPVALDKMKEGRYTRGAKCQLSNSLFTRFAAQDKFFSRRLVTSDFDASALPTSDFDASVPSSLFTRWAARDKFFSRRLATSDFDASTPSPLEANVTEASATVVATAEAPTEAATPSPLEAVAAAATAAVPTAEAPSDAATEDIATSNFDASPPSPLVSVATAATAAVPTAEVPSDTAMEDASSRARQAVRTPPAPRRSARIAPRRSARIAAQRDAASSQRQGLRRSPRLAAKPKVCYKGMC